MKSAVHMDHNRILQYNITFFTTDNEQMLKANNLVLYYHLRFSGIAAVTVICL